MTFGQSCKDPTFHCVEYKSQNWCLQISYFTILRNPDKQKKTPLLFGKKCLFMPLWLQTKTKSWHQFPHVPHTNSTFLFEGDVAGACRSWHHSVRDATKSLNSEIFIWLKRFDDPCYFGLDDWVLILEDFIWSQNAGRSYEYLGFGQKKIGKTTSLWIWERLAILTYLTWL